jgi:DME family drug/metabolite transporter
MAGVLLVCVAACLWGTVGVASGLMSENARTDPLFLAFARTGLGAACLLVSGWWLRLPWLEVRTVPFGLICVFGAAAAAFQIFLFAAFVHVGVTETVAVTVCAPVLLVALADAAWTRSVPRSGVLLAIGLGAVGVVLAVPSDSQEGTAFQSTGRAVLLLGGASLAFAVLAVTTRRITRQVHPVKAAGLGLSISTVLLLGVWAVAPWQAVPSAIDTMKWPDLLILLYVGVGATGGAYLAFVLGMHLCSRASTGLAASLIEPGVSALLAALLLHERLTAAAIVGCTLMMLAMVLLAWEERRRASHQQAAALVAP